MAGEMEYASLAGSVRSLTSRVEDLERQIAAMDDDIAECGTRKTELVELPSTDYAFKITAKKNKDGSFKVNVAGGTAQTIGGAIKTYNAIEIDGIEENSHVYLAYHMMDSSYNEVGEWDDEIHVGEIESDPPEYLVYGLGIISTEYANNVLVGHEGNVVMPAVSNVVDIQMGLGE